MGDHVRDKYDSGREKLGGKEYEYAVNIHTTSQKINQKAKEILGIKFPECYIQKNTWRILGSKNNILIQMLYAEDINNIDAKSYQPCEKWKKPELITNEQRAFVTMFLENCRKAFQVIEYDASLYASGN